MRMKKKLPPFPYLLAGGPRLLGEHAEGRIFGSFPLFFFRAKMARSAPRPYAVGAVLNFEAAPPPFPLSPLFFLSEKLAAILFSSSAREFVTMLPPLFLPFHDPCRTQNCFRCRAGIFFFSTPEILQMQVPSEANSARFSFSFFLLGGLR